MEKEIKNVPNGQQLADEIPQLIETAKKKREIYLDEELILQLRKSELNSNIVYAGKYNMYLGDTCFGFFTDECIRFRKVMLIRIKALGKYDHSEVSNAEAPIFFVLAK